MPASPTMSTTEPSPAVASSAAAPSASSSCSRSRIAPPLTPGLSHRRLGSNADRRPMSVSSAPDVGTGDGFEGCRRRSTNVAMQSPRHHSRRRRRRRPSRRRGHRAAARPAGIRRRRWSTGTSFPSDTLSTHQIARPGVVQLHRWGLLDAVLDSGAPAIRQVTFTAAGESVTRAGQDTAPASICSSRRAATFSTRSWPTPRPRPAPTCVSGSPSTGVQLDDAGRAIGVYGHDRSGAPVDLDARFVVGADGLGSRVARAVGAEVIEDRGEPRRRPVRVLRRPPWPGIELIVADRALTGVFPTHHGQACIWICSPTADAHAARRTAASREDGLHRLPASNRARTGGAAADRPPHVAGHRHAAHARTTSAGPTVPAGPWSATPATTATRSPATAVSDAYRDAELLADRARPGAARRRRSGRTRSPATSASATARCARSSTSPSRWPATRPYRSSSSCRRQLSPRHRRRGGRAGRPGHRCSRRRAPARHRITRNAPRRRTPEGEPT